MSTVSKAAFKFLDFKVISFSFNNIDSSENELSLKIVPKGEFDQETYKFKTILQFIVKLNDEVMIDSVFEFNFQIENTQNTGVPSFFYKNSLGIVFPYIRSFISTLTMQAGIMPLILPLLNLGGLESEYIENTKNI